MTIRAGQARKKKLKTNIFHVNIVLNFVFFQAEFLLPEFGSAWMLMRIQDPNPHYNPPVCGFTSLEKKSNKDRQGEADPFYQRPGSTTHFFFR